MNCEQLREQLDAYMDGELSADELRAMEAHAATCEDCKRELEAAKLVREALGALPEEVPVPLNVQARWRNAVRAEAKKRRNRRWLRAGYAVAAALVLALGATAVLRSMPERTNVAPVNLAAAPREAAVELAEVAAEPTGAVVARDGSADVIALDSGDEACAARKSYLAEDAGAACEAVEALIEEYSGSFDAEKSWEGEDAQLGGSNAIYRIELPREYLEDFLTSVSHVGEEQDSERMDTAGDTAIVYIEIYGKDSE